MRGGYHPSNSTIINGIAFPHWDIAQLHLNVGSMSEGSPRRDDSYLDMCCSQNRWSSQFHPMKPGLLEKVSRRLLKVKCTACLRRVTLISPMSGEYP